MSKALLMVLLLAVVILLQLLFGPSCGSLRESRSPGNRIDAHPPTGLDQLFPVPDVAAREASEAAVEQDGSSFDTGLPNQRVTAVFPVATFAPDWDHAGTPNFEGLAYAMYSFNMFDYFGQAQISVEWGGTDPAVGTAWFGLANYATSRWDWFEVPPSNSLAISPLTDYTHGTVLLAAIVVTGTQSVDLRRIWLGQRRGYFETEDNDTYQSANALPPMPFPAPVVNGSIGTGAGYPGYDGDSSDWFVFTVPMPGVASISIDLNKLSGSSLASFDFKKDNGTGAPEDWYSHSSDGSDRNFQLYFPAAGTYWLNVTTSDVIGDYRVAMEFSATTLYETENNDTWGQADPLPVLPVEFGQVFGSVGYTATPDWANGEVVYDGDNEDWFSFNVADRTLVAVEMLGLGSQSTDHELYMPDGTTLISRLAGPNWPDKIVAMLPTAGKYYVRVLKSAASAHANYYLLVKTGDTAMGWLNTTVIDDARINLCNSCSLCEVDGRPAIAFFQFEDPQEMLCYVRAEDAEGAVWGDVQYLSVLPGSGVFGVCSLAIIDGNPAIAYANNSGIDSSRLEYIRAADAQGGAWNPAVQVDSGFSNTGSGASLAEVNNKPAISYYGTSPANNMYYVQATDSSGDLWGTPLSISSVDGIGGVLAPTSLRVVGDNPAIAYTTLSCELGFVRAADADGSSWGAATTLYSDPGQIPDGLSLAVIDGNPALAFSTQYITVGSGNHIRYLRATDSIGSSWGALQDLYYADDAATVEAPAMAFANGMPVIAFHGVRLKFLWAHDAAGAQWDLTSVGVGSFSAGYNPSLAVVNGHAAVAHRWNAINTLEYTEYF